MCSPLHSHAHQPRPLWRDKRCFLAEGNSHNSEPCGRDLGNAWMYGCAERSGPFDLIATEFATIIEHASNRPSSPYAGWFTHCLPIADMQSEPCGQRHRQDEPACRSVYTPRLSLRSLVQHTVRTGVIGERCFLKTPQRSPHWFGCILHSGS